jgi:hypothetical protein
MALTWPFLLLVAALVLLLLDSSTVVPTSRWPEEEPDEIFGPRRADRRLARNVVVLAACLALGVALVGWIRKNARAIGAWLALALIAVAAAATVVELARPELKAGPIRVADAQFLLFVLVIVAIARRTTGIASPALLPEALIVSTK